MTQYVVHKSRLSGYLAVPPSKSHSIRALYFAALASGRSLIEGVLPSPDIEAAVVAFRAFGARMERQGEHDWVVEGVAGQPQTPDDVIDAGNSGLVFRFATALGGLAAGYTVVTGDASIRQQRPIQPLLQAMQQLGGFATSSQGNGCAPVIVRGPLHAGFAQLDGQDSQPVSALLMIASFLPGETTLQVDNPGELPWVDLTLDWLRRLQIPCQHEEHRRYRVSGPHIPQAFHYRVPGDFSSALYPIVAALVSDSEVTVGNLEMSDPQGDKQVLQILQKMGARLEIVPERGEVRVQRGSVLNGIEIDVNGVIDTLPLLAVLACFAAGETRIYNGAIARCKESDRIATISRELKTLGAQVEERPDGVVVQRSSLKGGVVSSHHDHRIALALAVAGIGSVGPVTIRDASCISKSYPHFMERMSGLGAQIQ